jgi:hypothetical protein
MILVDVSCEVVTSVIVRHIVFMPVKFCVVILHSLVRQHPHCHISQHTKKELIPLSDRGCMNGTNNVIQLSRTCIGNSGPST